MAKILLDTDIGSDIDDAVCLAYLLMKPECDLLGITTVTGKPAERAMICDALCKAAGKDIPIYPGTERPLVVPQRQQEAPQAEMLSKHPHSKKFPESSAVEFMRRTILANPGEVTLLTIGPLTNAALLFAVYPEVIPALKSHTLMCGDFLRDDILAEWNAACDPHATKIVYAANAPDHKSIGLNVTMRVRMSSEEINARFNHPVLRVVKDFSEVWFRGAGDITFHDPLAAAVIFNPDICTFAAGDVNVKVESGDESGKTFFSGSSGGRHLVAADVDPDRFFTEYFSVF